MRTDNMRAASTDANVSLFQLPKSSYRGKDRRKHKRMPRSIGINVQPLNADQVEDDCSYFAITRDISVGGLSFLSPFNVESELLLLALEDEPTRAVVSRVCGCCLIHESTFEKVYLTSVEFLYERFC